MPTTRPEIAHLCERSLVGRSRASRRASRRRRLVRRTVRGGEARRTDGMGSDETAPRDQGMGSADRNPAARNALRYGVILAVLDRRSCSSRCGERRRLEEERRSRSTVPIAAKTTETADTLRTQLCATDPSGCVIDGTTPGVVTVVVTSPLIGEAQLAAAGVGSGLWSNADADPNGGSASIDGTQRAADGIGVVDLPPGQRSADGHRHLEIGIGVLVGRLEPHVRCEAGAQTGRKSNSSALTFSGASHCIQWPGPSTRS